MRGRGESIFKILCAALEIERKGEGKRLPLACQGLMANPTSVF